jgi:radical SAM-linked protein
MRFLGHLDVYRLLLRALRRAGVPLVYSRGFNPKPRVAFGPALSVGLLSEGEYVDFEVRERFEDRGVLERLNRVLPRELRFEAIQEIARDAPALGESVRAARYRVHTGDLDARPTLAGLGSRSPLVVTRERGGKINRFELEREMLALEARDADSFVMTLTLRGNGASLHPEEALHEMFGSPAARFRLVREDLLVQSQDRLVSPLDSGPTYPV